MKLSTAAGLARTAFKVSGMSAPRVLWQYATLTYLNRRSRDLPLRSAPRRSRREPSDKDTLAAVDVVVPVFNNFEGTRNLLDRLRPESSQFTKIVIVNDASTDQRVVPMIQAFCRDAPNAILIENDRNLGFVTTCNRGISSSENDLVILNTDIELPRGAVARLIRTLRSDPRIATVTPFSSNAYGVGVPNLNYANERPFGATTDAVDKAFQSLECLEPIEIPRGVGFCMAISRDAVRRLGGFDPEFGLGYGEEADFCMRARQLGYRSVVAPDVYVYHAGGQSFGSAWQANARIGQMKFLTRHPGYVTLMREYLEGSPTRSVVFAAMVELARLVSGRDVRIFGEPQQSVPQDALGPGPSLQAISAGSGVKCTLRFGGEAHYFVFKNADLARSAFFVAKLGNNLDGPQR
jgi:GT2 family glycosyltransferase